MLDRAARILSLRGENRYRVRAYRRAARAVAGEEKDIEKLYRENKLQSLPWVGKGLAAQIGEILRTGRMPLLERIESGALAGAEPAVILLASALALAGEFVAELEKVAGVERVAVAGEARRCRETVDGLELVLLAPEPAFVKKELGAFPRLHGIRFEGNTCRAVHSYGLPLVLYLAREQEFVYTVWWATGSGSHVEKVRRLAAGRSARDLARISFSGEEEIYSLAGLPFIEPEMREDSGELEAADAGELPQLVRAADYRGDLHVHTDWSDGASSLEKMVAAAEEMGYSYLAITDHSAALKVARGLSAELLAGQLKAVNRLQERHKIKIFSGIEADILDDGAIDAPADLLPALDLVIASVHTGFRQGRARLTERICRAMTNPRIHILGHATGRLLGKREAYQVDMEEVIRTAHRTGTALEINSSPDRLDINGIFARKAKEAGVPVAVNTDAHSRLELANVTLGLSVARRGWLAKEDVLNTRETGELLDFLKNSKTGR